MQLGVKKIVREMKKKTKKKVDLYNIIMSSTIELPVGFFFHLQDKIKPQKLF